MTGPLNKFLSQEASEEFGLRTAFRNSAAVLLFFSLLTISPIAEIIGKNLTRPINFRLRTVINEVPLNPQIKVFAFDDKTAGKLQNFDITLADWAKVLEALAERKPARIIVDKLFDKPASKREYDYFSDKIKSLPAPVIPISFVTKEIQHRTPLTIPKAVPGAPWVPETDLVAYGARPEIADAFLRIGHALYDGDGYIRPMVKIRGGGFLWHYTVASFMDTEILEDGLVANGFKIAGKNKLLVNIASWDTYRPRIKTMLSLLSSVLAKKEPVLTVEEGDSVIILPAMYTGHTDWRETPHGSYPGGLVNVAMMNSLLDNRWIVDIGSSLYLVAIVVILATLVAALFTIKAFFFTLIVGGSALVVGCIGLFVLGDIHIEWVLPTASWFSAGGVVFFERSRQSQLHKLRMKMELETASTVQDTLFTSTLDSSEDLIISEYRRPASECSGDWWCHFTDNLGWHYAVLGDATGHGVGSALVTAMVFASVHQSEQALSGLEENALTRATFIANNVNHILCSSPSSTAGMTMVISVFDNKKGICTVLNCGHQLPFLYEQTKGSITAVKATGSVLGINKSLNLFPKEIAWNSGDTLILYTDGLIEIGGKSGKELKKKEFKQVLTSCVQNSDGFSTSFTSFCEEFFPNHMLDDDQTVIAIWHNLPGT